MMAERAKYRDSLLLQPLGRIAELLDTICLSLYVLKTAREPYAEYYHCTSLNLFLNIIAATN